jgi:NDP-sugar pyrophosphorylase family protein
MDHVEILPAGQLGKNFIPSPYLPAGQDEFYLRNSQIPQPHPAWRHLRADELEQMVKNGNKADDWDMVLVTDEFEPSQIKNSSFFGLVRIGRMHNQILEHHDMQVSVGITDSRIVSCDIGDDTAVHNVSYLAHYIIGRRCILANIDEMHTTNYAKFGNGIIKDGEPEKVRIWLDVMNEAGGRRIIPFDGMITADAYLWAKYREDRPLLERFKNITEKEFDSRRGYYGTIGDQCVIKNSRILKDVKIGPHCYIKGANKLKNLTIHSSPEEPSQIGEGVELVNGIIGYGCHIFYGCKAVRFILGNNSNLKYGARLIHSFLGDNSTISCCEVLNNLIFPAHEQHHNNSFLIASVVLGQSNMAAGATIGSNHNSRANDNEVQAGRGFWPGLCTSIKHSCRFASFVLLSKGDYPAELDIPLPFSLLNNNVSADRLEIMPAFWWLFNMYALARNNWKFQSRDNRIHKIQNIEFDCLAPDTAEEIFQAMELLELWTGKAHLRRQGRTPETEPLEKIIALGRSLLTGDGKNLADLEVLGERIEKSHRKAVILKPYEGYHAYRQMLHHYAIKNLLAWMEANPSADWTLLQNRLHGPRCRHWVNLGGQLMLAEDVDQLRADIRDGKLQTWQQIHNRYDELWQRYPLDKQKHAFAALCALCGSETFTPQQWKELFRQAVQIQQLICDRVYASRKKDYENPFRQATYRNQEEMLAVLGPLEENDFVKRVRQQTEQFKAAVEAVLRRD